jgi:hypothetical protein
MNEPLTITCPVHFHCQSRGRKRLESGAAPTAVVREPGRVPRVARLMALALRFDAQFRCGEFGSYTEMAALGHVTRARISQVMNLLNLAPDIQEAILFLPRTTCGRDPIHLRQLQPIASTIDWRKQRALWQMLTTPACSFATLAARMDQRPEERSCLSRPSQPRTRHLNGACAAGSVTSAASASSTPARPATAPSFAAESAASAAPASLLGNA